MENLGFIHFLKQDEIDKVRWDDCVSLSTGPLIYAHTFYLNSIASGWTGLVGEDYSWVLPITVRKKFGISYLYQPALTQQLGVFAKPGVVVPYLQILEVLQQRFRFWEINWNYRLEKEFLPNSIKATPASNYILDLSNSYQIIKTNYHRDLVKNLKKSTKYQLSYQQTNDYGRAIKMYIKLYGNRTPHVTKDDYTNFSSVCKNANSNNMLYCREAINKKQEVVAIALLLFDGRRLYNMMNSTTEVGRSFAANHFLIDGIINEFCGSNFQLDFEGSDLPGVKSFYENFGAINQYYYRLKYNKLPWPLKLFK